MPIYEWKCPKCGNKFEALVPPEPRLIGCINCGLLMKRVISISNFHLKGSGWAKDGYNK